jgi:hypothetical protein
MKMEHGLKPKLQALIDEEATRVSEALSQHSSFVSLAESALDLLDSFVTSIDVNRPLTAALYFAVQKSANLGYLSSIRGHTIQAEFNSRQLIEFTVLTAYELAHYGVDAARKPLKGKVYKWFQGEFPQVSESLKQLKDQINDTSAHASLYNTRATFDWSSGLNNAENYQGSFCEKNPVALDRFNLLCHARLVIVVIDALRQVATNYSGFALADDISEKLSILNDEVRRKSNILIPDLRATKAIRPRR